MPAAVARKSGIDKRHAARARSSRALPALRPAKQPAGKASTKSLKTNKAKPVTRRSQEQRREEAKQAILKAAFSIIANRGLDELTLQEAGEKAGVSRALPAYHFHTKDELVGALADYVVDQYIARLYRNGEPQPGLDGMLARLAFNLDDNSSNRKYLRAFHVILGAGVARDELSPWMVKFNLESQERIAVMLRSCLERGEIRPDIDVKAQSIVILSALRSIMGQWVVSPKDVPLNRVRDTFVDNIRRSLT